MTRALHRLVSALALAACAGFAQGYVDVPSLGSPLVRSERGGFRIDRGIRTAMAGTPAVHIVGFEVNGRVVELDLTRFEVLTPDARVVAGTDAGDVELRRPDIQFWRGTVTGDSESHVFVALSPSSANGYIRAAGRTSIISSGRLGSVETVIAGVGEIPEAGGVTVKPPVCDGDVLEPGAPPSMPWVPQPMGPGRGWTCRSFRLAVDCDYEFTQDLFGADPVASAAYAMTLFAASSEIYQRDVNVAIEVGYLRVWTTSADPYTATSTSAELPEFRSYWNTNMGPVSRNLAHLLSGRSLGGGIAYGNVVCHATSGYAVSSHIRGFFPYPLQDHNDQNWDIMVVTHEMGHNLGTRHTHDPSQYVPPIDGCGNAYLSPPQTQDCSQAWNGTIMSYCHLCSPGMANINLTFGTRVSQAIRGFLDNQVPTCGMYPTISIQTQPQPTSVWSGESASLSVGVSGHSPISYQWRRNGTPLSDDAHRSGSQSATLTLNPIGTGDAGLYDVAATDFCGTVTSNIASVSVGCYPNCDGSSVAPLLNANDFQCFLNLFAGADPYANCDGSSISPILNANDFACFLNRYATGCP